MIEPSADHRVFASQVRQTFLALVQEGFSEPQALLLVQTIIASQAQRPPGNE